jgi:hypothetical protein
VDAVEVDRSAKSQARVFAQTDIHQRPTHHPPLDSPHPARLARVTISMSEQPPLGEPRWIDGIAASLGVTPQTFSVVVLVTLIVGMLWMGTLRPAVVVQAEKDERERIARAKAEKAEAKAQAKAKKAS